MNKAHCICCEDNFYNGNNDLNVKECWRLKDAKMVWCKVISRDAYPRDYWKYPKQRKPDCYKKRGYTMFIKGSKYYDAKEGDYV
jgi:hypothetical protein